MSQNIQGQQDSNRNPLQQSETLTTHSNFHANISYPILVSPHHLSKKQEQPTPEIQPVEQIPQQQISHDPEDHQKMLPHLKIFDDKKQFNEIRSDKYIKKGSVGLPAVQEKQGQESKEVVHRLNSLVDKNQFGARQHCEIEKEPLIIVNTEVIENQVIKEIEEPEEEPSKQPITILQKQIQNLAADQIDTNLKKKHHLKSQIQLEPVQTIKEQKNEDQGNQHLRHSLRKYQHQIHHIKQTLTATETQSTDLVNFKQHENSKTVEEPILEENESLSIDLMQK